MPGHALPSSHGHSAGEGPIPAAPGTASPLPRPSVATTNPLALVAVIIGVAGLFLLPLVAGVAAVAAGLYGETRATIVGWGRAWAASGIVLGLIDVGVALFQMGRWS